ncbi:hypothetical protein [Vibrio mediterranei]|uniref:hypothetical protein n=1 Tax=Vibrio mediterranei TaxID=689 RepID=UPI002284515B|nr:hypothetical protein [Vibrio mediterranei]MCY9853084.1 hypothetical protein [Vibrio mediterranei]
MRNFQSRLIKCVAISILLLVSGCASFNDIKTTNNRYTTVGQELIDLKLALEASTITQEEYMELKEGIKAMAVIKTN